MPTDYLRKPPSASDIWRFGYESLPDQEDIWKAIGVYRDLPGAEPNPQSLIRPPEIPVPPERGRGLAEELQRYGIDAPQSQAQSAPPPTATPRGPRRVTFDMPKIEPRQTLLPEGSPMPQAQAAPAPGASSLPVIDAIPSIESPAPPVIEMPAPADVARPMNPFEQHAQHAMSDQDKYAELLAKPPVEIERAGGWHQVLAGLASMFAPTRGLARGLAMKNEDEFDADQAARAHAQQMLGLTAAHGAQAGDLRQQTGQQNYYEGVLAQQARASADAKTLSPGSLANMGVAGIIEVEPNAPAERYQYQFKIGDKTYGKLKTNEQPFITLPPDTVSTLFPGVNVALPLSREELISLKDSFRRTGQQPKLQVIQDAENNYKILGYG
ncbi:MAG: hypothetical protein VW338_17110, partial [Rhodospirillaceae bacterium]